MVTRSRWGTASFRSEWEGFHALTPPPAGDPEPRTLSASQVNKAYSCNRMWAYEYVAGIKPPPTYPMKKGTFIHAVIEQFNRDPGPVPGEAEDLAAQLRPRILRVARDVWQQGLTGDFEQDFREDNDQIKEQMFNYVDTVVKRFRRLRRRTDLDREGAWRKARPTANELAVVVTDEEGNWLFRGDIDSVFEKHPLWFDRTVLVDYKTGKSPFNAEEPMSVEYSRQLDIYTWLFYQAFGCVPEVTGIQFLAESPDSPTAFVYKEVDPGTVETVHMMLQQVRRKLDSGRVEEYERNRQYKWCEFEKNDGTTIKCDHWSYCLGDEEMPEPTDREYDGSERDPLEVVLSDPLEENLDRAEHARPVLNESHPPVDT